MEYYSTNRKSNRGNDTHRGPSNRSTFGFMDALGFETVETSIYHHHRPGSLKGIFPRQMHKAKHTFDPFTPLLIECVVGCVRLLSTTPLYHKPIYQPNRQIDTIPHSDECSIVVVVVVRLRFVRGIRLRCVWRQNPRSEYLIGSDG